MSFTNLIEFASFFRGGLRNASHHSQIHQLMSREPKKRTRSKFHTDEDDHLVQLVAQYGDANWDRIAQEMPGRNVRQCRERWKHYLSCTKPADPWTKEEDDLISDKVQEIGGKWTKIAALLPGRTDLQIKNRWRQLFARMNRTSKREIREQPKPPSPPPRAPEAQAPTITEDQEIDMFAQNQLGCSWGDDLDFEMWWIP